MKLQIDTEAKTVKIDELVNISELVKVLRKMLPDWKEYSIMSDVVWSYPLYPSYPYYMWDTGSEWIRFDGVSGANGTTCGNPVLTTSDTVYNVEIN